MERRQARTDPARTVLTEIVRLEPWLDAWCDRCDPRLPSHLKCLGSGCTWERARAIDGLV